MSISYPLNPPTVPGTQKIKLSGRTQASMSQSPFTGSQQIFEWPAEWWEADVAMPPMQRAAAEPWNAWALALRGRSGTFPLGDSGARKPQGAINAFTDLLRFTEAFDNAAWVKGASGSSLPTITANALANPVFLDVTADAINFAANTSGNNGFVYQITGNKPIIGGKTFTYSVYLKVPSGTASVDMQVEDELFGASGLGVGQSVTVTSSWQRFTLTFTAPTSTIAQNVLCSIVYRGTPAQVVDAWGAALDRGSVPTTFSRICAAQGPRVNGANQTGKSLTAILSDTSAYANTLLMLRGDYIQLGTGTSQRLYKLLSDVTTDGSMNATMDIFPRLRESPADQTPIYWYDTRGTFRLNANLRGWDLDEALVYGIQFQAIEAI